jgi:hypothetical protein
MKQEAVVLENFYSPENYRSLFEELHTHPFQYFWGDPTGSKYWNYQVTDEDNKVNNLSRKLFEEFKSRFTEVGDLGRAYINTTTFGLEPGAHYDYGTEDAVTVINYITNTWNISWGGETVLFDNYATGDNDMEKLREIGWQPLNIDKAVLPAYNRILLIPANQLHVARPLSRFFPGTRYTLMYKLTGFSVSQLMKNFKQ